MALAPALPTPKGCASLRRHAKHVGDLLTRDTAMVMAIVI